MATRRGHHPPDQGPGEEAWRAPAPGRGLPPEAVRGRGRLPNGPSPCHRRLRLAGRSVGAHQ